MASNRKTLTVYSTLNVEALLDGLDEWGHDDIVALIVRLDERIADWDFTIKLIRHFEELQKLANKEVGDAR